MSNEKTSQELAGKVAVVTGASRGIGAAIATTLAAHGARVIVNYLRSSEKAAEVCTLIADRGGSATAVQADIGDPASATALIAATVDTYGGIDILVNNAGWAVRQELGSIDPQDLDAQLRLNIAGTIYTTQAAAPKLRDNGRIINITSIAAKGGPGFAVYSATKAAGNALTKCFAAELGTRGITVNAIAPAAVETDLYYAVGLDKNAEASLANTPLGRAGSVQDVAQAVLFFASESAAWITGEILQVSGGRAM